MSNLQSTDRMPALHLHPARPVTAQDVADFERDGVVCLRGMFDATWRRLLHDAALEVMSSGQGRDLISIWIALTPVSKETSGVQYVAGSHRWGKMFRAVTPDYDPRFIDESMPPCPDYGAGEHGPSIRVLSWDMQPGDVLCHHPLTVHGAGGNQSPSQTRIGLSSRYLGSDVRWDPRPHTMSLRRDPGVPAGAFPADDVALPIVWERARGHLACAA